MPAVLFGADAVQKETEMLKKIKTDLRAVVMLIATENLSALRALLKNIKNLASKSIHLHRKT